MFDEEEGAVFVCLWSGLGLFVFIVLHVCVAVILSAAVAVSVAVAGLFIIVFGRGIEPCCVLAVAGNYGYFVRVVAG